MSADHGQQQDLEAQERELWAVLDRVGNGMGGQSEVLILASALGLSRPAVNKLGGTDEG